MSTTGEQSIAIERDQFWHKRRRLRVVLEYLDNGHAIQRQAFQFHEVKDGQIKEEVALVALQHAQDSLETRSPH